MCNSSRSAIQEDFDIYPSFVERVVEKAQFDRAIVLLGRNIDLLLRMRGVDVSSDNNMTSTSIANTTLCIRVL